MAAANLAPVRPAVPSFVVAVATPLAATLPMLLLSSEAAPGAPFLLYFGAIMVSAWYGGLGPGLVSTLLSTVISWYVFVPPAWSFQLESRVTMIRLIIFSAEGALISYLCGLLQAARLRADAASHEARRERQATLENERQYRLMVENVRDYAMFMTDTAGKVSKWNSGAERLLGWKEDEVAEQPGAVIFTPEDQENGEPEKEIEQARQTGHAADERWHQRKDGSRFFASGMMMAVTDETGALVGFTKVLRDETERRQAGEELRKFKFITDNANDSLMLMDEEARIVYANKFACRQRGYPEGGMVGLTIPELDPLFPISKWRETFLRARMERVPSFETINKRKDGTEFPVEITITYVELGGKPHLFAASRDITQRKRAELELRESEARLGAALAIANLGTFEWNVATNAVTLDSRSREIFGFGPGEGNTAQEVFARIDPADFDRVYAEAQASQRDLSHLETEYRVILPDGTVRTIVSISDAVCGPDGKAARMFGIFSDITERKRAEEALRASEERYRAVLTTLKEGVIVHDAKGSIVMANTSAERILGLSLDQLHGLDSFDPRWRAVAENGEDLPGDQHPAQIALKTGAPVTDKVFGVHRPDATVVWLSVSAIPLQDPITDRPTGVVASFFDITARKAAEEERERLLASERTARRAAETANAAKDQFLAVLSHELRNPLSPVLVAATLMLQDRRLPDDLREEVLTIQRNAQLEARLIDDLLDLSRIAKGKMHVDMRPVQIDALIAQSLTICEPEIKAKELEVTVSFNATRSVVLGDPARLQQVLWNLLRNAVKFSSHGMTIRIETHNNPDETLVVRVTDEGVGIAPEDLGRIFRPFEQAVRTSQFGGLGLGLTISRTLVELHHGTLHVESAGHGEGATFVLTLPTLPEQQSGAAAAPVSAATTERKSMTPLRILLVEDNADAARTMAKLLTLRGHTVYTASTVAQALALADANDLDVVVSDIGLGDASGLDLMRTLQIRRPGLPGIALSGYGMEADVAQSLEAGFARHLTKPVAPSALQDALAAVVNL